MTDLLTCPRCYQAYSTQAPTDSELWVTWELDALFDIDEPPIPSDGYVHRWKVTCAQGHVLALSSDYEQENDEQHSPPTSEQLSSVGAISWEYDVPTRTWVKERCPDKPDNNCYTLPDGSCVGTECMHDPKDVRNV